MKRLIKYWGPYNETGFSDCSTKYEVLPFLVEDSAGAKELALFAVDLNMSFSSIATKPKDKSRRGLVVTHSLELSEKKTKDNGISKESMKVYLGFITVKEYKCLPIFKGINKKLTKDQAHDIVNNQAFGVSDTGEIDGEPLIVMESWNYFHELKLNGYSLESFEKAQGITKTKGHVEFDDSVSRCDECGVYDYQDDGYKYNHRIVNGSVYGINCGCFAKACKNNLEDFVDDTNTPLELEAAKELEKEGRLVFVERFIGGMVDGRGGSFAGKRVREGTPSEVLAEYKSKHPKAKFVFVHDESGQFQTYFSIWKVKRNVGKAA